MADDTVTMPEHYKVLAHEFKGLVRLIDDAFINRPVPEGLPWQDIQTAFQPILGSTSESINKITTTLNSIPGCIEGGTSEYVATESIRGAVSALEREITNLIVCFHKIWKSPFPPEFADGQPVASAVIEDLLRECRYLFQEVIGIVEMPPEKAVEKYGKTRILLTATFGDKAIISLTRWLESRETELRRRTFAARKARSDTTTACLFGFLFGWWIGHGD